MDHPLIAILRQRRKELGLSKSYVQMSVGMSRSTYDKRENSGRFGALEQFDRWAALLGYKLILTRIETEQDMWS